MPSIRRAGFRANGLAVWTSRHPQLDAECELSRVHFAVLSVPLPISLCKTADMPLPPDLEGYWDRFKAETSAYWARVRGELQIDSAIEPHVFAWDPVPIFADLMLNLILHGGKRATAHPVLVHDVEETSPHRVGDHSVVLDGFGRPACVIRTTSIEIKPFREVDEAFAKAESEGGGSVRYWRQGHWAYLQDYCRVHGTEVSEDLPMVFEYFELIDPQ